MAREFYKNDPNKENVTWGALSDDEKEMVRSDMIFYLHLTPKGVGVDNPVRDMMWVEV
ncbi:MAG: hypothetical protein MJZ28_05740 [Paludibacteraceae bacterium]|nr:hypothetical protein [Paludibacteraceae bacterium]